MENNKIKNCFYKKRRFLGYSTPPIIDNAFNFYKKEGLKKVIDKEYNIFEKKECTILDFTGYQDVNYTPPKVFGYDANVKVDFSKVFFDNTNS